MEFKNSIINTALLGTGKKQLEVMELPYVLHADFESLQLQDEDTETKFIKAAALAIHFYRAGTQPVKMELIPDRCVPENIGYCSSNAQSILKELLADKYNTLIWFWCIQCNNHKQIVQPDILPAFLDWGQTTKNWSRDLLVSVIGHRGIWLSKYNPQWKFVEAEKDLSEWDTASLTQRIGYLKKLRIESPALALEKIQSIWKEENAAGRTELLATVAVNVSVSDEAFLISVLNDKSKGVKDNALVLLKRIPDSSIINNYAAILSKSILLKNSKLLGLISKTNIEVKLNLDTEEIFNTGIEKLSSNKNINDDDHILAQLIAEVAPWFWTKHFELEMKEVVKLFAKRDELNKFKRAFCNSIIKFADAAWAKEVLTQFEDSDVGLLKILPAAERQLFAAKFAGQYIEEVITALRTDDIVEWQLSLAQNLITETAQNPHRFNKVFYESISVYLPATLIPKLSQIQVSDEWRKNIWGNLSIEIEKLITIKESIKTQAF